MGNNMFCRLMRVLKKTHAMQMEVYLPSAWGQGVMYDVYASTRMQPQSSFERYSPQIALVAAVMLLVIGVPCVLTVDNALSLLDSQLIDAANDSAQLYLFM